MVKLSEARRGPKHVHYYITPRTPFCRGGPQLECIVLGPLHEASGGNGGSTGSHSTGADANKRPGVKVEGTFYNKYAKSIITESYLNIVKHHNIHVGRLKSDNQFFSL